MLSGKLKKVLTRLLLSSAITLMVLAASVWLGYRFRPQRLDLRPFARIPRPELVRGSIILPYTNTFSAAEVGAYDDELEAFLYFEYLRGRTAADGVQMLLTASPAESGPSYRIFVVGQDDLLTDIPRLAQLEGRGLIPHSDLSIWSENEFAHFRYQSHIFEAAYNVPVQQNLETLDGFQLQPALAEFLLFKSQTDIRILEGMEAKPQPLTRAQAEQSAADIIAVARFYDLPLDYFLGVGAMENNYMDTNGDLTHAVWKKSAQSGDIVLKHRRKRVLVSDYSIGAWQITRETVRYAHRLYLKDKRDYSGLPERLRPPRELDVNSVSDAVLTTYAGLLLRNLLDYFHGDVEKAIGAYNGGIKTPNPDYASGVTRVAEYARRVLEHAAVLNSQDPAKSKTPKSPSAKDAAANERPWWDIDP